MSRLMSRLPNLSSTAVRLACLDLWAQCLTRHRWALEDAGTISPGVAVVLDDAGAYSDQEVDAARAALKTLAARLCRQGDKERHDILSALLSWEHPSSMRGTSAETERRPDALSSQCADSLGVNEAAAIKVEALRNFLSGISSELCVALLKSSNWDLPAAVETALQGSLASQAASGRRAASSSPSFGRSSNPCSSDTEQSQTCSSHQPSSTARQRFAGCPAFPAAPPAMARTQQPYSNGTLQRPQPEGYQQSSVRRTPEDIQAAERAAAGIFGQDRPSSAYSFAGSAIPMQRTHYAGVAEAAKMKPNMASRGLQPESSALRRSVSLDDQAPRKRVGKQPNAAVQQRIRQRQAEVKAMLQDRHDFEQQKVRIRDRVKKKLVEVERSNDLVHVLKSFGFLCDAGTLKKTFRLAMIDLHPDKVAQGGASSLQEAVRKEEMFKILMSKRSLLDQ